MRLSLLISILIHVLLFAAVVTIFHIVPEMKLPPEIYNVKILQPVLRAPEPEPEVAETKPPPPEPEPEPEPKPKEKPEKKKPPKPEPKEPEPAPPEEAPLETSVDEKEPGDGTAMTVDAPRFPFSYYLSAIERRISQNWFTGTSAGASGLSCVVYFRLDRAGSIAGLRLETPSGNSYFDGSAMRAVRSSAPFPPLPKAFSEPWLGIHFTFVQRD